MAEIVLGLWTTHGPQLNTTPEQWMLRLPADRARRHWFKGAQYSYDELKRLRSDERLAERAALQAREAHHAACQKAIAAVSRLWAEISPDVCVIFGNDQRELMLPACQPAFTVFHGDSFWNGPLSPERAARLPPGIAESEWANRPETRTEYRGMPELAARFIATGLDAGWDLAASEQWPDHPGNHHHVGTPHAFAYILRRVMLDAAVPTLPIITNTFFPPNQPRPWRCFELGQLMQRVLSEWDEDVRVAVIGSGGMSHFVINEEFDADLIAAIQARNADWLRGVEPTMMQDGTSELLNWIAAAGCLFGTELSGELIDYVPCYRSEAGTGTAQGFLAWT